VNELKMILDRMGIDVWEVVRAAATKPFGFMPFFPGPVWGTLHSTGPVLSLLKAAEHGVWARFIELAGEINSRMPRYVIEKVALALNGDRRRSTAPAVGAGAGLQGQCRRRPRVAFLRDPRASPGSWSADRLLRPVVPQTHRTRKHDLGLRSVPCDAATFSQYDALVVSTATTSSQAELYREHGWWWTLEI